MRDTYDDFMPSETRIREANIARIERQKQIDANQIINCQRIKNAFKDAITTWDLKQNSVSKRVELIQPIDPAFISFGNRKDWLSVACNIPFDKITFELSTRLETPIELLICQSANPWSNNELKIFLDKK